MATDKPRLHWTEREALPVAEVAELLSMGRQQVHTLIADWAFGDPKRIPESGTTRPRKRIPTGKVKAFLAGHREYPPGDPRGDAAEPARASA